MYAFDLRPSARRRSVNIVVKVSYHKIACNTHSAHRTMVNACNAHNMCMTHNGVVAGTRC